MSKPKYYISTAIAYTSSRPHIGNTYEIVLADSIARYKRMEGYDVYFQTGTDEHGDKIVQAAEKQGQTPKEFVDAVSARFQALWPQLGVANDRFVRTTDEAHKRAVQDFLQKVYDAGDIYFGEPRGVEMRNGRRTGYNTMIYDEEEIRRIAKVAFETARQRRRKVCSVEKSNVLETSRLWKEVVLETHKDYADVELSHMYVDNAAMQLVRDPSQFDVILTGNIFGDILSDEASVITGSLGMLPSASVGASGPGLFEPIHGSAPDIAGRDKANPLATILSGAMLLRLGFHLTEEAECIENAVRRALRDGFRTGDIMEPGMIQVGCEAMGRKVIERL